MHTSPRANADAFASFHPLVNFLYFALVLLFTMFCTHPACLAITLGASLGYGLYLRRRGAARFSLKYMLPLLLLTALMNPAFNHEGATILGYLPGGNPLTAESVAYGLAMAVMLVSVILWFGAYNAVVTSDKFIYLFGRVIPALSLVLSMTLRLVPRFGRKLREITEAQRAIGRDVSAGSLPQRLRTSGAILSILITWALENALDTADSMRSRGYGLPGRSAFSLYRMEERDVLALVWLGFAGLYVLGGALSGGLAWRYFPTLHGDTPTPMTVGFFAVYLSLCLTPLAIDAAYDRRWRAAAARGGDGA